MAPQDLESILGRLEVWENSRIGRRNELGSPSLLCQAPQWKPRWLSGWASSQHVDLSVGRLAQGSRSKCFNCQGRSWVILYDWALRVTRATFFSGRVISHPDAKGALSYHSTDWKGVREFGDYATERDLCLMTKFQARSWAIGLEYQ